jgi:hypothetical protein
MFINRGRGTLDGIIFGKHDKRVRVSSNMRKSLSVLANSAFILLDVFDAMALRMHTAQGLGLGQQIIAQRLIEGQQH